MSTDYLNQIKDVISEFDSEKLKVLVTQALNAHVPVLDIVQKGIAAGLQEIGRKFEEGELFVTHLVAAAETAKAAIKDVIEPELRKNPDLRAGGPKIVIATVKGDIHDIGKNIVGALLFSEGFEVIDLGKDVPADEIVEAAKNNSAKIVGLSALLSTTIPEMKRVIEKLKAEGIRDNVKVMVGGAPVTEQFAREIGADGYGENATQAVALAKGFLGKQ